MHDAQEVSDLSREFENNAQSAQGDIKSMDDSATLTEQAPALAPPANSKLVDLWQWGMANRVDVLFWGVFGFFSVFMILPIWSLHYLPLGDLADHAGQIQIILNYENYQDDYRINWFTPYLVAYGLTIFLAQIFSIITSIKIVLTLCALTFPIGAYYVNKQLGGNRYWSLICFPASYSFAFYWGFYSFVVGCAISMFFFVFVLAYARAKITAKWYVAAFLFSLLLFFSHFMVWAIAICATPLIIFMFNGFKSTVDKTTAFLLIAPLAAYWLSISGGFGNTASPPVQEGYYVQEVVNLISREVNYMVDMFNQRSESGKHLDRVKELFGFAIGRGNLLDYVVITLCLLVWPLFLGAKLSRDIRRWLPLLYCVSMFMLVPYAILNTFYVYCRFAVFLLPFALFVYEQRKPKEQGVPKSINWYAHIGAASGFLATYLILASNYALFASFKENDKNFTAILEKMAPGKMVQSLIFYTDSRLNFSPAYVHYGMWYQAEKGGEVIFSFTHDPHAYGVPVRYKHRTWPWPSPWNAREFKWSKHRGELYDYFLVRSDKRRDYLFPASKDIVLIEKRGKWYLYGRKSLQPAVENDV